MIRVFGIGGKLYSKVRFAITRHEDIFPLEQVKSGDFEDLSLLEHNKAGQPKTSEEDMKALRKAIAEGNITTISPISDSIPTKHDDTEYETVKPSYIFVTDPAGNKTKIKESVLEQFCKNEGLDIEAVKSVIDGKQKTHRKWRFRKA